MKTRNAMALTGLNTANPEIKIAHMERTKLGLQPGMMKTAAALFLLVISTLTASAQKFTVLSTLSKYGIDASILNASTTQQPEDYAYDFKQTTITAGKQNTTVAKFDPSSPKEEQWTVVSVDGKSPSKSETNTFRKNQAKQSTSDQTDESSYKIEKESPDHLVISYKPDPNAVPKDAAFMKDCRSYMTINLKTKKLEQVQVLNEKPVKIKILNAEKFDIVMKFNWNDQAKRYFCLSQNLNMQAKFMGQPVTVETITEYSNYSKK
ncbi:hypothetical protein [Pedobacter sp.]|jgi:hypothetical protein|uniref:hypothetical protein n=1 Tax=Pedobacter sp. TaxID=1411316 RepID=UPI002C9131F0|nr:hypothetical protein [Pedobacter sp.]HWW38698.1 hypothetical protein [Pedobacter sp.]